METEVPGAPHALEDLRLRAACSRTPLSVRWAVAGAEVPRLWLPCRVLSVAELGAQPPGQLPPPWLHRQARRTALLVPPAPVALRPVPLALFAARPVLHGLSFDDVGVFVPSDPMAVSGIYPEERTQLCEMRLTNMVLGRVLKLCPTGSGPLAGTEP